MGLPVFPFLDFSYNLNDEIKDVRVVAVKFEFDEEDLKPKPINTTSEH